jgi:hypothetical protein
LSSEKNPRILKPTSEMNQENRKAGRIFHLIPGLVRFSFPFFLLS